MSAQRSDLADRFGLYARLGIVCDDTADIALDAAARQLPAAVLQHILCAGKELQLAARAVVRHEIANPPSSQSGDQP